MEGLVDVAGTRALSLVDRSVLRLAEGSGLVGGEVGRCGVAGVLVDAVSGAEASGW